MFFVNNDKNIWNIHKIFTKNQTTKLNIGNIEEKGLQLRLWRIGKLRTANAVSWI